MTPDGELIELPEILVTKDHGGTADAWNPHGASSPYYGFIVSGGGHFNQDPVSGGAAQTNAPASHYYSGYWAGVQGGLYGFGPPESSPIHSYGFVVDLLGLDHPGIPSSTKQGIAHALGGAGITHTDSLMWLTPDVGSWNLGSGEKGDWPADLPDWGAPAPRTWPPPQSNPYEYNDSDGIMRRPESPIHGVIDGTPYNVPVIYVVPTVPGDLNQLFGFSPGSIPNNILSPSLPPYSTFDSINKNWGTYTPGDEDFP